MTQNLLYIINIVFLCLWMGQNCGLSLETLLNFIFILYDNQQSRNVTFNSLISLQGFDNEFQTIKNKSLRKLHKHNFF